MTLRKPQLESEGYNLGGYNRTYYETHRSKFVEASRQYRKRNPDKVKNTKLRLRYGITLAEKQLLHKKQQGRCAICDQPHETLCVDHNHITRKVRGLLCLNCNKGLGHFYDSPERLYQAINYLRRTT